MLDHFHSMIEILDFHTERLMDLQCMLPGDDNYGVIPDFNKGYTEPVSAAGYASSFINAYFNRYSRFYHCEKVLKRGKLALEFLLRNTNDDGTIDLKETNFHDSTANGFAMHSLGYSYKLLNKFTENTPLENEVRELLHRFTVLSGDAMVNCGFHTTNHRWVVSAALGLCWNLTGDRRYREHAQKFINEGIDCDAEGEYSERSAGIYNIVCNRSLAIMAEEFEMPELYEHITRNLRMVMKYFEPDGTICTMNSTRQDFGKDIPIDVYYENYLYMAIKTRDPEFAWLADYMLAKNMGKFRADPVTAQAYGTYMPNFLLNPSLIDEMLTIPVKKPDFNYEKHFEESGIVRIRKNDTTLTLIKGRPDFLKLQYKEHKLYARFAGAFFGPLAQFAADTLEKTDNGYRLVCKKRAGYRRPFNTRPDTWVWAKMDHSKRENVCMQDFITTIDIAFTEEGITMDIDAGGCSNIPVKLELITEPGGIYSSNDTLIQTRAGDYIFLKKGTAEYIFPSLNKFVIEGGFFRHNFAANMRGALPADREAVSIVMTGFTPVKKTVSVKIEKPSGMAGEEKI